MKKNLFMVLSIMAVILAIGCTGQKEEPTPTPAPTTPPPTTPPPQVVLHGVGTCDTCHEAPALDDTRAGKHKIAFEKQLDLHKDLCTQCHDVQTHCAQCHELPSFYQ